MMENYPKGVFISARAPDTKPSNPGRVDATKGSQIVKRDQPWGSITQNNRFKIATGSVRRL
ncbi:hypothetical protein [Sedimentitalea sp. HM32M-2]|uniref:hypothetical protein n=1 Tax=Sedimentitalea sp. HM32M-2 TaxID=3351566 RepID=UPI0036D3EAF6